MSPASYQLLYRTVLPADFARRFLFRPTRHSFAPGRHLFQHDICFVFVSSPGKVPHRVIVPTTRWGGWASADESPRKPRLNSLPVHHLRPHSFARSRLNRSGCSFFCGFQIPPLILHQWRGHSKKPTILPITLFVVLPCLGLVHSAACRLFDDIPGNICQDKGGNASNKAAIKRRAYRCCAGKDPLCSDAVDHGAVSLSSHATRPLTPKKTMMASPIPRSIISAV